MDPANRRAGRVALCALLLVGCGRAPSPAPAAPAGEAPTPPTAPAAANDPAAPNAPPAAEAGAPGAVPAGAAEAADLGAVPTAVDADPASPLELRPDDAARMAETTEVARKAMVFLRTLDPEPARLRREHGMLGHKHHTEYLAALHLIAAWPGDPKLAAEARAMADALLRRTASQAAFHDMAAADDQLFFRESMSYLSGCHYARLLGHDLPLWKTGIAAIQERLDRHLATRGVDQRMSFAMMYKSLQLPGGDDMLALYPQSLFTRQPDFSELVQSPGKAYELTHEVFALTLRGRRLLPVRDERDLRWARRTAYGLLHAHATEKLHDSAAELLLTRVWLGDAFDPQMAFTRKVLIEGQRPDGSIGFHTESLIRAEKGNPKYDIRHGAYLHTTMIALWALMASS